MDLHPVFISDPGHSGLGKTPVSPPFWTRTFPCQASKVLGAKRGPKGKIPTWSASCVHGDAGGLCKRCQMAPQSAHWLPRTATRSHCGTVHVRADFSNRNGSALPYLAWSTSCSARSVQGHQIQMSGRFASLITRSLRCHRREPFSAALVTLHIRCYMIQCFWYRRSRREDGSSCTS